jgi:hypothetical protein
VKTADILVAFEFAGNGFVALKHNIVQPRQTASAFSSNASALNQ